MRVALSALTLAISASAAMETFTNNAPTPVLETCTTHAKCRDLHKEDRHEFFCHGWTNVTGVCMECTQCHENTSPFSGNCQDACGHDPVHVPNSLCRRDEDCQSQSFCDWDSLVHVKESVWHRCSPCSLHKKGYDTHLDRCVSVDTRRPTTTDAPTQPPTLPPTPPPKKKKPSTVDRIHDELEDLSKTMGRLSDNTELQSKNTSCIKWLLVVLLVFLIVRHCYLRPTPCSSLLPRYQLHQHQIPIASNKLGSALEGSNAPSPPVNPLAPHRTA